MIVSHITLILFINSITISNIYAYANNLGSFVIPIELLNNKPQIYFYDRDFGKELALWSVEGSAIID